jgi:hypothetical protein
MGTTARLEDLKRDLARLEQKRTGSPRGTHTADGGRGREAEHPRANSEPRLDGRAVARLG